MAEEVTLTTADIATLHVQADQFEGCMPLPGLENLGRAIVDAAGVPSGSPANYEHLRGATGAKPVDVAAEVAKLAADPALKLPE
jgi:hypothetical protein